MATPAAQLTMTDTITVDGTEYEYDAERPYRDADLLEELYFNQELEQITIADELGCGDSTISRWIDELDIPHPTVENKLLNEVGEQKLSEMYHDDRMSMYEIASKLDTSQRTVGRMMECAGIERRRSGRQKNAYARYRCGTNGYCVWRENGHAVLVHRLLAVAEYGLDAVDGNVVHHENHIQFDNRHDNIQLMDRREHASYHAAQR